LSPLTTPLAIAPDAAVDFQLHTTYSDGTWSPEQLIDFLVGEGFGLAAITDHDRLDTIAVVRALAAKKGLPLLAAVEISAAWNDQATDVLCFGVDPDNDVLEEVVQTIARWQRENTDEVCSNLQQKGITFPHDALQPILDAPGSSHPNRLAKLLEQYGYGNGDDSPGKILKDAGCEYATMDIAQVVDAVHLAGGLCLIAHPGRGGSYLKYDNELLNQLRDSIPIDGFEAYYPAHTPEQTAAFVSYAKRHGLLTSSGSDSHGPARQLPIKYRADLSRRLLERLGVEVK
jgi:3',5'-nucleoside bisphosphate phosphatase